MSLSAGQQLGPYEIVATRGTHAGISDGGAQSRWSRDGREFFFIAPDGKLMAADVKASGKSFQAGVPHALFQTDITATAFDYHQRDVAADGQKFLINSKSGRSAQAITLIVNWTAMLNAR